jgi:hypothetical protein
VKMRIMMASATPILHTRRYSKLEVQGKGPNQKDRQLLVECDVVVEEVNREEY